MTKNQIFRQFHCNLSIEDTAELCFKSVSAVKRWDEGSTIPKECKRLMRMQRRLELSSTRAWQSFNMRNNYLELPTGQLITAQQILAGAGLLEISSELETRNTSQLLRLARSLDKIKRYRPFQ
ncbi:regulator [Vibrio europaeus]|uniref:Regulator n=1 Tax=Vibrio europaeus TaxID=300876 RepID=A0A178J8Q8_9VIBR|nr:regulator [Vibrio europaeus]MDC5704910.1 regulator [Vibrio europaeus]MDC5710189.1 regulator [Vibrio europaeus]MDC5715279.1 regulator [Vibrio europaeus]MDC5724672.1 regulator [Vibrio europaeus]MDC5728631.1 regulator [Vibrio europaeus]